MVAMTVIARISSGVAPVTSPLRIVTSPSVPGARWPRRASSPEGVGRVEGHGPQALLGGQQLIEQPRRRLRARAHPPVHPGGDLVDGPAQCRRSARSPGRSTARRSPRRRAARRPRSRASGRASRSPRRGCRGRTRRRTSASSTQSARAVEVDHRGDVHGDQAGQLLVRHLEGVLDPVVERIRPGRAERRLVGVEDQLQGRGAHGVDRDLPAGLVGAADGLGEVRRLPVDDRCPSRRRGGSSTPGRGGGRRRGRARATCTSPRRTSLSKFSAR